ncbi:hypothetical protein KEM55_003890, partial [Ascosphaera atra]
AAMAENLAHGDYSVNDTLLGAYNKWSEGGWGALLTGNVNVDEAYFGGPYDVLSPPDYRDSETDAARLAPFKRYAETCQKNGSPTIVQINHPGRQCIRGCGNRGFFEQPLAPSAIPMSIGDGWFDKLAEYLLFAPPKEMTQADIDRITNKFVDCARVMSDAGFAGVELHGAHGYLIDEFLNPKTNHRTDAYGGSAEKRAKFVLDIIKAIREVVPSTFAIGIKLNSADQQGGNFEDIMTQIGLLADAGIDFLEISGGSYENPLMMGLSERTKAREAYFLDFSAEVRKRFPSLVLMVTGGFRSRAGAKSALEKNACDLIGLGRPAAIDPNLPHKLLDEGLPDDQVTFRLNKAPLPWILNYFPIKAIGVGAES